MKSGPHCRFPYRATLSAALSLLSLCAFVLLVASADRLRLTIMHQPGTYPENLFTVVWLVGASAGVLFFVWSRRTEPRLAAGMAGVLALVTGLTLVALV